MGCVVQKDTFEKKMSAKIVGFSRVYVYYTREGDTQVLKMKVEDACKLSVKKVTE